MTLRARLTLVYAGVFLVGGAVLLAATYLLVAHNLEARIRQDGAFAGVTEQRASALAGTTFSGPDGRPVSSAEVIDAVRAAQERYRSDTLDTVLTQGALALACVTALAAAAGWVVADRVLRPLHRITDTASRIAAGSGRGLGERIGLGGPDDEVRKLAATFDEMLAKLDHAFDGQRRFVANASHELRTPLALNRALAELAITRPGAAQDTVQLGESLLAVNARHEQLIDGLLTLADSETAVTEATPVDLADVVAAVLPDGGGIEVRAELAAARTAGDPVLLERMVQNLLENAVRHNVENGRLEVQTFTDQDTAVVTVSNTGPVVPAYEVESLFQPFRRLTPRQSGPDRGVGLGLSIVRAVARAHSGTATARPREGGGLVVTIVLPARRQ